MSVGAQRDLLFTPRIVAQVTGMRLATMTRFNSLDLWSVMLCQVGCHHLEVNAVSNAVRFETRKSMIMLILMISRYFPSATLCKARGGRYATLAMRCTLVTWLRGAEGARSKGEAGEEEERAKMITGATTRAPIIFRPETPSGRQVSLLL